MSEKIVGFTVSYDGEALQNNQMDVRDLGPALLSLGQLFDEANQVLNGDKTSVKIHVKALKPGSFGIEFLVDQNIVGQITGFLTGDVVTSALALKELLLIGGGIAGGFTGGLIWLIKKLKGKKPDKVTDLKNGNVRLDFEGETFEVPLKLLRLYQDIGVRTATRKILKPLESKGIDSFSVKEKEKEILRVEKEFLSCFDVPEIEDEILFESVHDAAYSIISLAFKDDNKWRLHDGNSTISVTIKDEDFLKKVDDNQVSFSKGDVLLCRVSTVQYRSDSGLKSEYTVLKINEHRKGARQIQLPFDEA